MEAKHLEDKQWVVESSRWGTAAAGYKSPGLWVQRAPEVLVGYTSKWEQGLEHGNREDF